MAEEFQYQSSRSREEANRRCNEVGKGAGEEQGDY